MEQSTHLFLLILFIASVLFFVLKQLATKSCNLPPLPPGPSPLPILGNILQVGRKFHLSLANLAHVHGPLLSLKLGSQLVVVGSSPEVAAEILKNNDLAFSARPISHTLYIKTQDVDHLTILGSECNQKWKTLRAICHTELFSIKAIESHAQRQEHKVKYLVDFLITKEGEVVKIGDVVSTTFVNTLGRLFFSNDFADIENEKIGDVVDTLKNLFEIASTPNFCDYYPILCGLDVQGLHKGFMKNLKRLFASWDVLIDAREESKKSDVSLNGDFMDILLANGFSKDQIKELISELFVAGVDTSAVTVEWIMSELIKNEDVLNKVRQELANKITGDIVTHSDLPALSYLNACVKETLRLHPSIAVIPRRAIKTCQLMEYTIPQNCYVLVNLWALGRDEAIWKDPLAFKPCRFLDSNLDSKGCNFEFLPFGAGRRICPGLSFAVRMVPLIVASLVHRFDWCLPDNTSLSELDMKEKFGLTLHREKPLLLVPKLRRPLA